MSENENEKGFCNCTHGEKWLKCIVLVVTVFAATFLAVYFVADQTVKQVIIRPHVLHEKSMHKIMKNDEKMMKMMDKEVGMPMMSQMMKNISPFSELIEDDDEYKIIINLKHFNNNVDNLKFNIEPYKVTISGAYNEDGGNFIKEYNYKQTFTLDQKIDTTKVKKEHVKDKCILILPIEE